MPTYNEEKYKLKNLWNSQQFYDIAYDLLKNKSLTEAKKTINKHSFKKIHQYPTLPLYTYLPISNSDLPFIVKLKLASSEQTGISFGSLYSSGTTILQSIGDKYYFKEHEFYFIFNPR